jgi:competence protein ComEC
LFDAGPASARGLDFGEAAVVPALRALGVERLDTLLISHGDNDHSGGMGAVQRAFAGVRTLGAEGWARPGMGLCQSTQAWRWDGVDFQVVHPPPLFPYLHNDSSCVLRIEAGGRVALLPGDIGRHVETRLLREQGSRLRAELLVVPHHGSMSSSSEAFIQQVQPRWAVISAGADNRFRLPRAEVLARYSRAGARILNTAETGALRLRLDADGARLLSARRQQQARYWREPVVASSGYAIGN